MIILLALLFLFRQYGTSAAPVAVSFAEPSAYNATLFVRDDSADACPGRSVWDIVWSCLATTFAVTWVSVHPNVPRLEESSWHLLKRRMFLMCLALLAPEVMIMWAFKQWRGALMIKDTINKARPNSYSTQWTMTHAHFLQMGGFRVNHQGGKHFRTYRFYTYNTTKMGLAVQECSLNFYDLRKLLYKQLIHFPETTAKEIEDRSKSDALSKGVALLQISWFLIQLIARAHQNLAITEIELTTAALAGLNSIMYLFWWNKPFDVRCPIVIRTKELEWRLAEAGRNLNERAVGIKDEQTGRSADRKKEGDDDDSGIRTGKDEKETGERGASLFTSPEDGRNTTGERYAEDNKEEKEQASDLRNVAGKAGNAAESVEKPDWSFPVDEKGYVAPPAFDLKAHLMTTAKDCMRRIPSTIRTKLDWVFLNVAFFPFWLYDAIHTAMGPNNSARKSAVRRFVEWIWTCCKSAVAKLLYLPYLLMALPMQIILNPRWFVNIFPFSDAKDKMDNAPSLQLLFKERDMAWIMSMMFYSEKAETRPLLIFSALAGAAFGSIHCAAWNSHFPSHVEQVLWRTASLAIVGICICIIAGIPLYNFALSKWWPSPESKSEMFWDITTKTLETAPAIVYPLARVSLLILSLLSLRNLSPSALDTVSWTKFIPHI